MGSNVCYIMVSFFVINNVVNSCIYRDKCCLYFEIIVISILKEWILDYDK